MINAPDLTNIHDAYIDQDECWQCGGEGVSRIGKKRAGRLLDGIEHSAMAATMPTGKANA